MNMNGAAFRGWGRVVLLLVVSWCLALVPGPAWGEDNPVSITSDQMEADDQSKMVTFLGHVVARQKDVVLNCDVMRVYYMREGSNAPAAQPGDPLDAMGGGGASEIERIECDGNVKVTQGEKMALSEKAVFMAKATPRVIILTGEPRIWRNRDYLTGRRITFYLDENRSVVEGGGPGRVNATFYTAPQADGKDPATAPRPNP